MLLLILKIILSELVVYLSILLGRKLSSKYTGLVASFPTVVALVILFVFWEQGIEAARITGLQISHAIVLFNIWMIFYFVFRKFGPMIASIASIVLYFFSAYIYGIFFSEASILSYLVFLIIFIFGFRLFLPYISSKIVPQKSNRLIDVSPYIIVPIIVVGLTLIAKVASPIWAGILISFPSTGLITVLYFHKTTGNEVVGSIFESMFSFTTTFVFFGLVLYYLSFSMTFLTAWIISMCLTAMYSYCFNIIFLQKIKNYFNKKSEVKI